MKKNGKEDGRKRMAPGYAVYVLLFLLCAAFILTVGHHLTKEESTADGNGAVTVSAQDPDGQEENEGWDTAAGNPLCRETDQDVLAAVDEYYQDRSADSSFAEGYDNLQVYTKQGKYRGTSLAFVCYEMKIRQIYTPVPGMDTLFVSRDSRKDRVTVTGEAPDEETEDTAELLAAHEDVQDLMEEVQVSYDEAVASDAILKEALSDLKQASLEK